MTYVLTAADRIWNRACQGGGDNPRRGDSALASLLLFHGPVMNGGVDHGLECLSPSQLLAAKDAYAFFGFIGIAELIERETQVQQPRTDAAIEALDNEYWRLIPDDSSLVESFKKHFRVSPTDYAPLEDEQTTGA